MIVLHSLSFAHFHLHVEVLIALAFVLITVSIETGEKRLIDPLWPLVILKVEFKSKSLRDFRMFGC